MENFAFILIFMCILILLVLTAMESSERKKYLFYLLHNKALDTEEDLEIMDKLNLLKKRQVWTISYLEKNSYLVLYLPRPGTVGNSLKIKKDLLYHSQEGLLEQILADPKSKLKLKIINPIIYKEDGTEIESNKLALQIIRIK